MPDQCSSGEYPEMDRGDLQDRAVRGAAWTVIHMLVSLPLAFAVNLVLARILGVTDYGRLAYLTINLEILTGVVALGMAPALIQFGSRAHATGRGRDVMHLLSITQGFRLFVQAPVLTILVIVAVDIDRHFMAIAVVFGIWVPAALSGSTACLQIENKTSWEAKVALIGNLVVQLVVLLTAVTLETADAVWGARTAAVSVLVVLALFPISASYRRAVLRPKVPRHFPVGFWRFAVPVGFAGLVSTLVLSRTEVLALTWLSTESAVGIFALAFGIATHMLAPAQAFVGPLVPAIAGLSQVDGAALGRAYDRALRGSTTMAALMCSVALPVIASLVPLLYGEEYDEAVPLLIVLGISGGFMVATGPVAAFVLARSSAKRLLSANLAALAVDVVLVIALVPGLGIWGAAIASVAGSITRMLLLLSDQVSHSTSTWSHTAIQVVPLAVGAVACGLAWVVSSWAPPAVVLNVIATGLAGGLALLVGLRITRSGITPEDAEVLTEIVPRRLKRPLGWMLTVVTVRR